MRFELRSLSSGFRLFAIRISNVILVGVNEECFLSRLPVIGFVLFRISSRA
jgi:hypothetical protein